MKAAKKLTASEQDLMKRVIKAKTNLVLGHPFFGTFAMNMDYVFDETLNPPTAAVDGERVYLHPEFVKDLTDEEMTFLIAHECFHPMLEHNYRRMGRNHRKWNMAGDYVINQHLVNEGIGKMPEGGLLDANLFAQADGNTDRIYNLLPDSEDGGSGPDGQPGNGPLDDCRDADGSQAEVSQKQAEMRIKVAQAAQAAKMMGKLSAGLERLVGELLTPKINWADVLQRFMVKAKDDQRTYARPNRRFIAQGLYTPSVTGERLGEVVFAVDCSGSIGPRELDQYASEINKVFEDHKPAATHIVYFDSEVCHYDRFGPDDTLHIEAHGGGGTAFSPVFRFIEEQGIEPVACVFLTDLCCNDFGDVPDYPVLWISTWKEGTAPFGDVVYMDLEVGA